MTSDTRRERVHALWDEVSGFGGAQPEAALDRLLAVLAELVNAQQAYWLSAVRLSDAGAADPAYGWRARSIHYLHSSPEREARYVEQRRRLENGQVDASIVANLKGAGSFRTNLHRELVPESWFESEYYREMFARFGLQDSIYVSTPLDDDAESWLVFQRAGRLALPRFGEDERKLLEYALRPMKWFHRKLMLHHGLLIADEQVTPAERRVLDGLLTSRTEQELADELNLSPTTVHTYSTRIFRKFNVRGRAGLTALWLGQMPANDEGEAEEDGDCSSSGRSD